MYHSATAEEESIGQLARTSATIPLDLTTPLGTAYLHSFTMDKGLWKSDEERYAAGLANICKQSIHEITRQGSSYIAYASKDFHLQSSKLQYSRVTKSAASGK